jgi:hypothetical protein
MARLTILTPKEIHTLYGLSQFTDEERDAYFALDPREKQAVKAFRTFTAKTYFILQLGYFKAKKQFLSLICKPLLMMLHTFCIGTFLMWLRCLIQQSPNQPG